MRHRAVVIVVVVVVVIVIVVIVVVVIVVMVVVVVVVIVVAVMMTIVVVVMRGDGDVDVFGGIEGLDVEEGVQVHATPSALHNLATRHDFSDGGVLCVLTKECNRLKPSSHGAMN